MNGPLQILIAGPDPQLRAECEAALSSLRENRPVTHYVSDFRQAAESAHNRHPNLALVQMDSDLSFIKTLADEISAASPETVVAGVFRPDIFGHDAPESTLLIEALRAGVNDFLRRPVSAVDLWQLVERLSNRRPLAQAHVGKVVAFLGNKGGVGKSTLAVNAAVGLALRHPDRVLLIDASLQMGVCAAMLDLQPPMSLTDSVRERSRLDEMLLRQLTTRHVSGLHLLAAPADALEGAEIDDEMIARIVSLSRRCYEFVIVDTFPVFDRVVMAVLDLSDRAYLVLENVVLTILGCASLLKILDAVQFQRERQRIVVNRYSTQSGNLRPLDVAMRLQRSVDHLIPYSRGVVAAANLGEPYMSRSHLFAKCARRMQALIDEIDVLEAKFGLHALNGKAGSAFTETLQEPSPGANQ